MIFFCFPRYVFPNFYIPGAGGEHFGPEIRILREKSSLEPAGKLSNPDSKHIHEAINVFICLCFNLFMRLSCDPHNYDPGSAAGFVLDCFRMFS